MRTEYYLFHVPGVTFESSLKFESRVKFVDSRIIF